MICEGCDSQLTHAVGAHHIQVAIDREDSRVMLSASNLFNQDIEATLARDWDEIWTLLNMILQSY